MEEELIFKIAKDELEKLRNGKTRMVQLFKDQLEFRAFDYGQELVEIGIRVIEKKNKE